MKNWKGIAKKQVLKRKLKCPKCRHKSDLEVELILDKGNNEVHEIRLRHDRGKTVKIW